MARLGIENSPLRLPAVPVEPSPQHLWPQSNALRPHRKRFSFSATSYISRPACIKTLFRIRSPAAIFWAVVAVYIYSIKRMFRRWLSPHVIKELFKGVPPSPTYFNAATAVSGIPHIPALIAPADHGKPSGVFLADSAVSRMAVRRHCLTLNRRCLAPAALKPSIAKKPAFGVFSISAVAVAHPPTVPQVVKGFEGSKSLAGYINKLPVICFRSWHKTTSSIAAHSLIQVYILTQYFYRPVVNVPHGSIA